LDVSRLGDVGFEEQAFASRGVDELESFVAFGFAAAGEDDLGAVSCEEDGRVAADASGAAR